MEPLLTSEQVAKILGISPRTVIQLCNRRKLRFIKVTTKNWRFTEEMVREFLDSQEVQVSKPKTAQRSVVSKSQQTTEYAAEKHQATPESVKKLRDEIDAL